MNFLLSSGIFPSLDSQVMAPGAAPQGAPVAGSGAEFGNLLDLVSDMQVADEQGHAGADFVEERSSELFDPQWQELSAGAVQAGILNESVRKEIDPGMPAKNVGRAEERTKVPSSGGTKSAQELLIDAQGLETVSRADLLAKHRVQSDNDAGSARMWAAAIATGDLKSVSVEKEPEIPVARSVPSAEIVAPEPMKGLSSSPSPKHRDATVGQAVREVKTGGPSPLAKQPERGEEASPKAIVPTESNPKPDAPIQKVASTEKVSADSFSRFEAPVVKSREEVATVAKPAKRSQTGGEFLLERSAPAASSPATASSGQVLVETSTLGKTGDRRISSESLDFVANKVDALRNQGGGRLKLEMSPKELGSIEIRVSMARGQMKVELRAEKRETLKAFHDSRADLASKLDQISPEARIDMGELHAKPNVRAVDSPTGDLLSLRTASSRNESLSSNLGSQTSDGSNAGSRQSPEKSADWVSGRTFGQDQREERRGKALDQWEDSFEGRKSA